MSVKTKNTLLQLLPLLLGAVVLIYFRNHPDKEYHLAWVGVVLGVLIYLIWVYPKIKIKK